MTSRNRQWRAAVSRDGILLSTFCTAWEENKAKESGDFQPTHTGVSTSMLYKKLYFGAFSAHCLLTPSKTEDRIRSVIILLPLSLDYCSHISFCLVGWLMSPILTQNIERNKWLGKSRVLTKFLTGTSEVLEIHLPWDNLILALQIFLSVVPGKLAARTWGNSQECCCTWVTFYVTRGNRERELKNIFKIVFCYEYTPLTLPNKALF